MLTICPTPIGNLDDVTIRQREALQAADVIICEDTRVTGKLLQLIGVTRVDGVPRLMSFHEHNEDDRSSQVLRLLEAGKSVVLCSDAGTPALADPGFRIVAAARDAGVETTALPGPFAAAVALSGAGLPTDRFVFAGFLSPKSGRRREALQELSGKHTLVLYESPKRVLALLGDVEELFGPALQCCVGRELTKLHEEWLRGTVGEVSAELEAKETIRGEMVVVLAGFPTDQDAKGAESTVKMLLTHGLSPSQIKAVGAELTGLKRSQIYQLMTDLKEST